MSLPIKANTQFTLDRYAIEDTGVRFYFIAFDPGPGLESEYNVFIIDGDINNTNANQMATLITTRLTRKIRATGLTTKIDPIIGQKWTV